MSKKMMLLALAVAALFALPSAASAQEIHFSGGGNFNISGPGGSLSAQAEPTITCTKTAGNGSFNAGSTTTGSITLDFTGCTAEFFGIKGNCSTGATSGTIASSGTFHLVTIPTNKAGVLVTTNPVVITCAGFLSISVTGDVIGTITSPACGVKTTKLGLTFKSNGTAPPIQEHMEYTGVKYDLKAQTSGSSEVTAGLTGTGTIEGNEGTLECT